jgi:hypothetical protein
VHTVREHPNFFAHEIGEFPTGSIIAVSNAETDSKGSVWGEILWQEKDFVLYPKEGLIHPLGGSWVCLVDSRGATPVSLFRRHDCYSCFPFISTIPIGEVIA